MSFANPRRGTRLITLVCLATTAEMAIPFVGREELLISTMARPISWLLPSMTTAMGVRLAILPKLLHLHDKLIDEGGAYRTMLARSTRR
jgi:hypothetical protein